ncbi:M48 family metalloprotease [Thermodesulfobacterium sp. TA1]|uniref:M48 family metallopeptidase n=1 Tax=Thermodesulfobacterium sp. TA1 TaxID=2234087 RepID=UPI001231FE27|nr:M48 family metallopeptidase [Thermodesulfobacterium sp. TA1]QER42066.1 M48 family metalloprotease [Thermodesulfobacterium sp. TA1]
MFYEDLIYLWVGFLLFELFPETSFSFPISFLVLKEILFVLTLLFCKKFLRSKEFSIVMFNFFNLLVMGLFVVDLGLFGVKSWLSRYYFSSFLGFLWFLHYVVFVRVFLFEFSLTYLKILLGMMSPILFLVFTEEVLAIFNLRLESYTYPLLLIVALFLSPVMMIKFFPVKVLTNLKARELVLGFFKTFKVTIREIYVLQDFGKKVYTAGVIGFFPKFRYIFFSQPLLDLLDEEELLGVLAHELGHIKNRHGLWLLLVLIGLPLFLTSIFFILLFLNQFLGLGFEAYLKRLPPYFVETLGVLGIVFLAYLYVRYVFGYFLRQFEREADFYALKILGNPKGIISSLIKIGEVSGQLYRKSWHHYGIFERVCFLQEAFSGRYVFKKHWLKIRLTLITFLMLNLVVILFFEFLG